MHLVPFAGAGREVADVDAHTHLVRARASTPTSPSVTCPDSRSRDGCEDRLQSTTPPRSTSSGTERSQNTGTIEMPTFRDHFHTSSSSPEDAPAGCCCSHCWKTGYWIPIGGTSSSSTYINNELAVENIRGTSYRFVHDCMRTARSYGVPFFQIEFQTYEDARQGEWTRLPMSLDPAAELPSRQRTAEVGRQRRGIPLARRGVRRTPLVDRLCPKGRIGVRSVRPAHRRTQLSGTTSSIGSAPGISSSTSPEIS